MEFGILGVGLAIVLCQNPCVVYFRRISAAPRIGMAGAATKQKPWQRLLENFDLDLIKCASWSDSGVCSEVQDAISGNSQPRKYDTRDKAIKYLQHVRDLAAKYLEQERAHDGAGGQYPYLSMKKLGKEYVDAFIAGDKKLANFIGHVAVDAIGLETKDAMTAAHSKDIQAALHAFTDAGLEAMQAFKSALQDAAEATTAAKADAKTSDTADDVEAVQTPGCKRKAGAISGTSTAAEPGAEPGT